MFFENLVDFCSRANVEQNDGVLFRGESGHRAFFDEATSKIVIFKENKTTGRWRLTYALKLAKYQADLYKKTKTVS